MIKQLDIFIDGSHLNKQHGGRLGIGGIILDLSKEGDDCIIDHFSHELTPEFMKSKFDADTCSNPSAELTALLFAINEFKSYFKTANSILVHADYLGVKEWMSGNWKVKEKYIANIKSAIDKEIDKLGLKGKIQYAWVKGHQKNDSVEAYWNNCVDKLAKGL